MFFNPPPKQGFQQPLFPQNQFPMNQQRPMRKPRNPFGKLSQQNHHPQPTQQPQPIRMFAPPGTSQPVQGFNPLLNNNGVNKEAGKLQNTISNLLGNTKRTEAGAGATVAATGASLLNGVNGLLDNVQKATEVAQSVKPAMERFGPMIKNLPSLLKIYKEVNNDDAQKTQKEIKVQKEEKKEVKKQAPVQKKQPETIKETPKQPQKQPESKSSNTPKLYI